VYRPLLLTNTGDRSCELTGFPGVSYVTGDSGEQVGPAAAMNGERGGRVPLAVGQAATAQLRMVDVGNFDVEVCRPTPVRGLRIYPPGDTASLFVPLETTGCAGTPPGDQIRHGWSRARPHTPIAHARRRTWIGASQSSGTPLLSTRDRTAMVFRSSVGSR
jgi:hypothetical protein